MAPDMPLVRLIQHWFNINILL